MFRYAIRKAQATGFYYVASTKKGKYTDRNQAQLLADEMNGVQRVDATEQVIEKTRNLLEASRVSLKTGQEIDPRIHLELKQAIAKAEASQCSTKSNG